LLDLGNRCPHAVDSELVAQHFQIQTTGTTYLTGMLRCSRIAHCQVVLPSSVLTGPWIWSAVLKIVPCEGCDAAGSPYCLPALARRQDNWRGNILCSLTELPLSLLLLILIVRWLHRGILASTRALCIWSTFPPGPKLVPCTGCNSQPAQGTSLNAAGNSWFPPTHE
jgi:hypothetical protein